MLFLHTRTFEAASFYFLLSFDENENVYVYALCYKYMYVYDLVGLVTEESAVWFPFSRCWRSNVIRLPDESRESGSTITKKQQEKRDSTAFIATRFDDVSLEKFL